MVLAGGGGATNLSFKASGSLRVGVVMTGFSSAFLVGGVFIFSGKLSTGFMIIGSVFLEICEGLIVNGEGSLLGLVINGEGSLLGLVINGEGSLLGLVINGEGSLLGLVINGEGSLLGLVINGEGSLLGLVLNGDDLAIGSGEYLISVAIAFL